MLSQTLCWGMLLKWPANKGSLNQLLTSTAQLVIAASCERHRTLTPCVCAKQVYKSTKVHCLQHLTPPATTLGLYLSRCQYVWVMKMDWQEVDGAWTLTSCRIAPDFPPTDTIRPLGSLMTSLDRLLALARRTPSLRDVVMCANEDPCVPLGFRWLVSWLLSSCAEDLGHC